MSLALLDRRRQRPLDAALRKESPIWSETARSCADTERSGKREVKSHGSLTLDELIAGTWEGLIVGETVRCPACDGRMTTRAAVRAEGLGGGCLDCGAQLS
jgi:hypothetical protein